MGRLCSGRGGRAGGGGSTQEMEAMQGVGVYTGGWDVIQGVGRLCKRWSKVKGHTG